MSFFRAIASPLGMYEHNDIRFIQKIRVIHSDRVCHPLSNPQHKDKEMLDDMHKCKIDMADAIYVINVGGYIGESTRSEIEYALKNGKKVYDLEPVE